MQSVEDLTQEEFSVLGFLSPVTARWKTVLLVTLLGAISAFGITRLRPRLYESSAVIFVQQSSKVSAALRDLPMPISMGGSSSSDYVVALLRSDTLMRRVLLRLNLANNSDFTERRRLDEEHMLDRLRSFTTIKDSKGTITIAVRAPKPQLAAKIGNSMLDSLGKLMVTTSKRKANFISLRINETAHSLRKAEDDLQIFQEKNDVTLIEEDAKQKIEEMSALDARLLELDAQLQECNSELANAGELNSLVDQEVRRNAIRSSRDYVQSKRDALRRQMGQMPSVAVKYARVQRRISVLSKTYELLTQQYQLARITQQGEDGDYQIVDRARPKSQPLASGATTNGAIGGVMSFVLASVVLNVRRGVKKRAPQRRVAGRSTLNV